MVMRDWLQGLFVDNDFVDWFPADGRRGVAPARLALVSVLQYAVLLYVENLTDRQATRAVACRIDWKYALGMELTEPGFDHSVLSEFRDRLAEGVRADRLLAVMVDRLAQAGLVRARGRQRTDSTHVLAAVRRLGRVELVAETMRVALEDLARVDEVWLTGVMQPQWADRYGRSARHERQPTGAAAVRQYVEAVGADGMSLLRAVYSPTGPAGGRDAAAVEVLRRVWVQQFWYDESGTLQWREAKLSRARKSREGTTRRGSKQVVDDDAEPARVPWSSVEIVTPHDPEARFSHKPGRSNGSDTRTIRPRPVTRSNRTSSCMSSPHRLRNRTWGSWAASAPRWLNNTWRRPSILSTVALSRLRRCTTRRPITESPSSDRSVWIPAPRNGSVSLKMTSSLIGRPRLSRVHKG